jgi:nucleoside-diphosphate-sugar epimerase
MRVMVTGAAGYIGSVLCSRLVGAGFKVLGVDCFLYHNQSAILHLIGEKKFDFLEHDVRDVSGMAPYIQQADAIIPLAAIVGAPACEQNPSLATQVNSLAIRDLVGQLSPSQRIIFPNTNSGYGQTNGQTFVSEKDPLCPVSHYGQTKLEAENAILDHPQAVSLRLATVFGPSPRMRFDLLVNDFTRRLCQDRHISIFEPHFQRNFVHVRDVARLFKRMLRDDHLEGVYNIGLPEAQLSKLELAYFIAGLLGLYPPDAVTIAEGRDPDQRNYKVSSERLLATGFSFAYDLADGVLDMAGMLSLLNPTEINRMQNT